MSDHGAPSIKREKTNKFVGLRKDRLGAINMVDSSMSQQYEHLNDVEYLYCSFLFHDISVTFRKLFHVNKHLSNTLLCHLAEIYVVFEAVTFLFISETTYLPYILLEGQINHQVKDEQILIAHYQSKVKHLPRKIVIYKYLIMYV